MQFFKIFQYMFQGNVLVFFAGYSNLPSESELWGKFTSCKIVQAVFSMCFIMIYFCFCEENIYIVQNMIVNRFDSNMLW